MITLEQWERIKKWAVRVEEAKEEAKFYEEEALASDDFNDFEKACDAKVRYEMCQIRLANIVMDYYRKES